jgi:hypothetical protein
MQLRAWALRRHPKKSKHWIMGKYWRVDDGHGWRFQPPTEGRALTDHAKTSIIKGDDAARVDCISPKTTPSKSITSFPKPKAGVDASTTCNCYIGIVIDAKRLRNRAAGVRLTDAALLRSRVTRKAQARF